MRTFSPHGFCLAIVVGLVAMFGNSGLAQYSPGKFIVVLDGDSAASSYLAAKPGRLPGAAAQSARTRAAQIRAQHDAFSVQFKSMGAAELSRHSKLLNAITIRATDAQIGAIKKLPGVKSVHRSRLYELNTTSSVPFIGAPAVWSGITNADGNGIRIGIIDTGIDYT